MIREFGLAAKKSLGQNFILDLNLTRRIARAAGPLDGRTVVEVGPGPGGLTRALLLEGAARVIAVERDERTRGALEMIAQRYPGKLDVHFGDALEADWPSLLGPARGQALIVANLPYGIATLLLTGWLDTEPWPPWFQRMVLMFQKEVAERIVAAPGSKAYGRVSVLAQWRSAPAHRAARAARSLHAGTQGCIRRRRVHPAQGALAAMQAEGAGAGDGGGVRSAAQNAALQPQAARRRARAAARSCRHCRQPARRGLEC